MQAPGVKVTSKGTSADWCDRYGDHVPRLGEGFFKIGRRCIYRKGRKPIRVRCPLCKRRVKPQTKNAEPFGSFDAYYVLPIHKKPHKKRIKS